MKFDDILTGHLGEFGRYQKQQYALLCISAICCAAQVLIPVFTAEEPPFRCSTNVSKWSEGSNLTQSLSNHTASRSMYGACFLTTTELENTSHLSENTPCTDFEFEATQMYSTIVTDWSLVCKRKFLSTMSSMVYMAGVMVGSFVAGVLSDRFGRRKSLLMCLIMQGSFGVGSAVAPEIYSYITFRFFTGGASVGVYLIAFVLAVELVGPSKRLLTAIVITSVFSTGYFICSGLAFALRRWRAVQLTVSVPSFLLVVIYYWLIKESPRWLLSKGRTSEAQEVLRHAFKFNKVPMPVNIKCSDSEAVSGEAKDKSSLLQVFKSRVLLIRTIALIVNWMALSMCYYGLSYNSRNLSGSLFINLILIGLVEFPAEMAVFLCAKLGRKGPHIFGMLLGGVSCGSTLFLVFFAAGDSSDWLYVALNMAGKFGITMGFCIIYFWSAEVYPTVLRNTLLGVSSACARIGSISAPLIADAGRYVDGEAQKLLAPLLFSMFALVGGLLAFVIPETSGEALPDTTQDTSSAKPKRRNHLNMVDEPRVSDSSTEHTTFLRN